MRRLLTVIVLGLVAASWPASGQPSGASRAATMLTVDMAYRINAFGDYGVANALGFISYLMTGLAAWVYLRQGVRERSAQ